MTVTIPLFFFQSKLPAELGARQVSKVTLEIGVPSTDRQSAVELGVPMDKLICRLATAQDRERLTPAPYFLKPQHSLPEPINAHAPQVVRPFMALT